VTATFHGDVRLIRPVGYQDRFEGLLTTEAACELLEEQPVFDPGESVKVFGFTEPGTVIVDDGGDHVRVAVSRKHFLARPNVHANLIQCNCFF
jgi:hypothetical protein